MGHRFGSFSCKFSNLWRIDHVGMKLLSRFPDVQLIPSEVLPFCVLRFRLHGHWVVPRMQGLVFGSVGSEFVCIDGLPRNGSTLIGK